LVANLSSLLSRLKGIPFNETIELLRTLAMLTLKTKACGGYASYLHVTYDESTLGRALPEPIEIVL